MHSSGLIARLAVDKYYTGQKFGEWLLVGSFKKLLAASDLFDFLLVIVDAKEGAINFYKKLGFTPFMVVPHWLLTKMLF